MPRRDYIDFQARDAPVGFLITFRCYGTWLHGDERGSIDRQHRRYGTPTLPPSPQREERNRRLMKQPPVKLDSRQRPVVESAIKKTCTIRGWRLCAISVRTNHVHAVIGANKKPEAIMSALKANATRALREAGIWPSDLSPWEVRGSKKYLWDEEELANAISYVASGQGEPLD